MAGYRLVCIDMAHSVFTAFKPHSQALPPPPPPPKHTHTSSFIHTHTHAHLCFPSVHDGFKVPLNLYGRGLKRTAGGGLRLNWQEGSF